MNQLFDIFSEVLRISTFQQTWHRRRADKWHHARGIDGSPGRRHHERRIGAVSATGSSSEARPPH